MEVLSTRIKKMSITSIVFSLLFIVTGIFLLLRPETAINVVCYVIGVILVLWGVVSIIQFFSDKNSTNYLSLSFIFGSFVFIFGIIILIKPAIVASIVPLLIGVWMVINGVTKLSYSLSIYKFSKNMLSVIGSIFIIVFGVTLIFNPFEGAKGLTQIIGIFLIVYSLLDLIESITISFSLKGKTEEIDGKIIEAKYKEKENK
jgi:uncharacterized membrane protein HdeD (DUF308 family)